MRKRTFGRLASAFAASLCLAAGGFFVPAGTPSVPDARACVFGMDCSEKVPYCDGGECSIGDGAAMVKKDINDIEKDRKASSYLQSVIAYLLGFLALVGLAYLMYSGFVVMTSSGDEEKVKKAKGTIRTVGLGLILIFLAYAIVDFFFRTARAEPMARTELSDSVGAREFGGGR